MGLLTLVEDRPTPSAVYNWRVYACAAVASFASCMIGYDSAFIGTTIALPSFVKEFGFKKMKPEHLALIKANIVTVYQAGAFFGSLLAYASAYYLGRRKSLWVFVTVFMVGAGIMLAAKDGDLAPIYAGRVLAGLGVGGSSMIVSIKTMCPSCAGRCHRCASHIPTDERSFGGMTAPSWKGIAQCDSVQHMADIVINRINC